MKVKIITEHNLGTGEKVVEIVTRASAGFGPPTRLASGQGPTVFLATVRALEDLDRVVADARAEAERDGLLTP